MLRPETTRRRRRAILALVACGVVLSVLLLSPVTFRGEGADIVAVAVVSLIGAAATHEVASRALRYAVLYPLCVLGPTVAACGTAMDGEQRSVAAGDGCRIQLDHDGWVASAWVRVDVLEAITWTPFEISRASGQIEAVDELGQTDAGGGWRSFRLADMSVRRTSEDGCTPSFAYRGRSMPVTWITGRQVR